MKINYLILALIILMLAVNASGQTFSDITSKKEAGHQHLFLDITDKQLINDYWHIIVKAGHDSMVVGFKIRIKEGLKPGLIEGEMDNTAWSVRSVEMSSIGTESNDFVKVVSKIYGIKPEKTSFSKPVVFTCFSLNSEKAYLNNGYFKFKLFFDDTNVSGIYTEIFLNINLPENYIEIPDYDPEHQEGFVKAMVR